MSEILKTTEFIGLRDKCAVAGAISRQRNTSAVVLEGLIEQNHRGQEGAGITTTNGREFKTIKKRGLAEAVFFEGLPHLDGSFIAIGQDRYSTSGSLNESQPFVEGDIALAHNGNLTNILHLREKYGLPEEIDGAKSDSRMALAVINKQPGTDKEKILAGLKELKGAYSFVIATKDTLYASRDPQGFKPLSIGKLDEGGFAVASESSAFFHMGAKYLRDVLPGETVAMTPESITTIALDQSGPLSRCIFELVYIARIDSKVFGISVMEFRLRLGQTLAKYLPPNADVIIPVPRSGIGAAQGVAIAEAARIRNIPYLEGIYTNPYRGIARGPRTFIHPEGRRDAAKKKYSPIEHTLRDRVVVVVDDSIVRGSLDVPVGMARGAGAREVHALIACAELKYTCYFGVDMKNGNGSGSDKEDDFIANRIPDKEERRKRLGLDSLHYVSNRELVEATLGNPIDINIDEDSVFEHAGFCGACITGRYPIPVDGVISKH